LSVAVVLVAFLSEGSFYESAKTPTTLCWTQKHPIILFRCCEKVAVQEQIHFCGNFLNKMPAIGILFLCGKTNNLFRIFQWKSETFLIDFFIPFYVYTSLTLPVTILSLPISYIKENPICRRDKSCLKIGRWKQVKISNLANIKSNAKSL